MLAYTFNPRDRDKKTSEIRPAFGLNSEFEASQDTLGDPVVRRGVESKIMIELGLQ